MIASFWVGMGFGFVLGAAVFDFAWRWLRRKERELADAIATETRRAIDSEAGVVAKR